MAAVGDDVRGCHGAVMPLQVEPFYRLFAIPIHHRVPFLSKSNDNTAWIVRCVAFILMTVIFIVELGFTRNDGRYVIENDTFEYYFC
jgi:hypothetical protein